MARFVDERGPFDVIVEKIGQRAAPGSEAV